MNGKVKKKKEVGGPIGTLVAATIFLSPPKNRIIKLIMKASNDGHNRLMCVYTLYQKLEEKGYRREKERLLEGDRKSLLFPQTFEKKNHFSFFFLKWGKKRPT
jgi:hypothetical protein